MMNDAFQQVIEATDDERRDLFLATARRLGTVVQNVAKDFWVCWTLDALFNGPSDPPYPRPLLKGGTSLSTSFGLINRFSEDVEITVFRDGLGEPASIADLEALSGKKRRARLEAIKAECQAFIGGPLLRHFLQLLAQVMERAGIPRERYRVELDSADPDRQTLLFRYPAVTGTPDDYIRSAVRIEAGAKSALDPNVQTTVRPYVADDVGIDLQVSGITTVEARRTFWDKVIILHGLRRWHDHRGQLRHGGQRVSRHYYDVFKLLESAIGAQAEADRQLAADCARHARMFFNTPDFDLEHAVPGTLALVPSSAMREPLQRDYDAMAGMIMGAAPDFAEVTSAQAAARNAST